MRRGNAVLSAAIAVVGCSPQPEELPPLGHVLLYVDTDAPVPVLGAAPDVMQPAPLLDTLRVEVFEPGADSPCDGCTHEFRLDDALLRAGATFTIEPQSARTGLVVRLVAFREGSVIEGALPWGATVELVAALPPIPREGEVVAHAFLSTDSVGVPTGTLDAPVSLDKGAPTGGSKVGTWPDAQRKACAGPAPEGMVCVPGGAFWMGNPVEHGSEHYNAADHMRLVVLPPFFVDAQEATVASFRASGLGTPANIVSSSGQTTGSSFQDWCTFVATAGARDALPLNCVPWDVAGQYCQTRGGRLPSEAELEYVAGALESRRYVWGSDVPTCSDAIWGHAGVGILSGSDGTCRTADEGIGGPITAPAASTDSPAPPRARDALELPTGRIVDLAGNLSEWAQDRYNRQDEACWSDPGVYHAPVCDILSPTQGDQRSVRGGNWIVGRYMTPAAHRDRGAPANSYPQAGVRCAADAP